MEFFEVAESAPDFAYHPICEDCGLACAISAKSEMTVIEKWTFYFLTFWGDEKFRKK